MIFIAAGLAVGLAAAFSGLGGGFLMVPLLIYLGFTPQKAVGTTFLAIFLISLSAIFAHNRLENIDYKMGIYLGLGGIIGAQVGARLVESVPSDVFRKVFGVFLLALGIFMLVRD